MTQENALLIFKSLSDASRLRIVRSLAGGDAYAELLAERLGLTPSTVSFHALDATLFDLAAAEPEQTDEQQKREDAYRRRVIDAFFEYGKLRAIPVQRKKKLICYEVIAEKLVPGKVYDEKELSDIIAAFHEDYCTIRRDMVSEGILRRDNGRYVRVR